MPKLVQIIALDALLGTNVLSYVKPWAATWHPSGCALKKMMMGQGYDDLTSPFAIFKVLIFDRLLRLHRGTADGVETEWGKIHHQYVFYDYYRMAMVVWHAWGLVRVEVLESLGPDPCDDVCLLLDFLENDLVTVLYWLPAQKLDPETMDEFLQEFQILCARYNMTGYGPDMARMLYDLETMDKERRVTYDENRTDLSEVPIEYLHGRTAAATPHNTESSVTSINCLQANMFRIDRGCHVLALFNDDDVESTDRTYSLASVHSSQELIEELSPLFASLFALAKANKSTRDGAMITTTAFCNGDQLTYKAALIRKYAAADDSLAEKALSSVKKVNGLETLIPHSVLVPRELECVEGEEKPRALSQMDVSQIKVALRLRQIPFDAATGVSQLRKTLAPSLRQAYVKTATETDGSVGRVCALLRRAAVGDLSFIGEFGLFETFEAEKDNVSADDFVQTDESILNDENDPRTSADAAPPDGFQIVEIERLCFMDTEKEAYRGTRTCVSLSRFRHIRFFDEH